MRQMLTFPTIVVGLLIYPLSSSFCQVMQLEEAQLLGAHLAGTVRVCSAETFIIMKRPSASFLPLTSKQHAAHSC